MSTLEDYDALPYTDCPIAESHPNNLYIIGRLFGMKPAPPDACKVLEIGCAGGGNLIPMAYYWPQSQFVGVELSKQQAAQANHFVDELQLQNILVHHQDLLSLDKHFGQFDYIIAHGIFSWVPENVQQHLLTICRECLKPNGLAYISYNTLPGWEHRKMLRDMMLYHARTSSSPQEKLTKSLELLTMLHKGLPSQGTLSERWLRQQAEELLKVPANYLFHDYLEKNNTPIYFHQFMQQAQNHELQYVAEASLYTMLSSSLTDAAETMLDQFDNPIEYEQYMDFFYIKHFRQTVLCHSDKSPQRTIDVELLKQWYFYSNLYTSEEIDLNSESTQSFVSPLGDEFTVSHPLSKAALVELAVAYPNMYGFEEIAQRAKATVSEYGNPQLANQSDALFNEIVNLVLSDGIKVSSTHREFSTQPTEKPRVCNLTKLGVQHNKPCIASVHHQSLPLSILDRAIIPFLDGKNSVTDIEEKLLEKINQQNELKVKLEKIIADPLHDAALREPIQRSFFHLASYGLLEK